MAQRVKESASTTPETQEICVGSWGQEDSLQKEMAIRQEKYKHFNKARGLYPCFVYVCETGRKSMYLETKNIYIYIVCNPENEHRIAIQLENVDIQRGKEHESQCVYDAAKLCLDLRKNKT